MSAQLSPYATLPQAAADALRALGCRYEDLDRPPIIQESEDVLLVTPAQIAALQAEIVHLQSALNEIIMLARQPFRPTVSPLTIASAVHQFSIIVIAAQDALYHV